MKKINFRKTLFAAVLLFQLNAHCRLWSDGGEGSVKDNTGKPISSQVGVRENLKVRYKYGYLSKKQVLLGTVKSKIYQWLHERKK